MTGWLIYRLKDAKKNKGYIELYFEEGKVLGIDINLILVDNLSFGVENNELFVRYNDEFVEMPDFVINRSRYPLLTKHLEDMGIQVFNNSKVAEICNDKAKTYQYISRLDIPIVDTKFIKSEDLKEALDNISSEDLKEPLVIKGVSGHGGNQVFLYDHDLKKHKILQALSNNDVVIQPLIGDKNQDLRVYVIGKTIVAAILRTAKNGFKSNYSLGGEVGTYQLSQNEIQLITKIINEFNFGLVGIDFLIDNNGSLIFNEIEDVVGARMLYQCTDINIVSLYLKYILSHV